MITEKYFVFYRKHCNLFEYIKKKETTKINKPT